MPFDHRVSRRKFCHASLAALGTPLLMAGQFPERKRALRVSETAGLRRYSYPVHAIWHPSGGMAAAPLAFETFRLLRNNQIIPAQFTPVVATGGIVMSLDFDASLGPLETLDCVIEYGGDFKPGPEAKGGMRVEHVGSTFQVSNGSALRSTLSDDLAGFLKSFGSPKTEYLEDHSEGFFLTDAQGNRRSLGSTAANGLAAKGIVTRSGPFAVALRYDGTIAVSATRSLPFHIDVTFPRSKSWVEATWTVDDPDGTIATLGVGLRLKLDGQPRLFEFGANSNVYGELKKGESAELTGSTARSGKETQPTWSITKTHGGSPQKIAESPRGNALRAEGWAHVTDRTRATAIAMAQFGATSATDRIHVAESGEVEVARTFSPPAKTASGAPAPTSRSLTVWYHFVPMPVPIGAVTSPQAMLAPLEISWPAAK